MVGVLSEAGRGMFIKYASCLKVTAYNLTVITSVITFTGSSDRNTAVPLA